jgi:hypothetical protein
MHRFIYSSAVAQFIIADTQVTASRNRISQHFINRSVKSHTKSFRRCLGVNIINF